MCTVISFTRSPFPLSASRFVKSATCARYSPTEHSSPLAASYWTIPFFSSDTLSRRVCEPSVRSIASYPLSSRSAERSSDGRSDEFWWRSTRSTSSRAFVPLNISASSDDLRVSYSVLPSSSARSRKNAMRRVPMFRRGTFAARAKARSSRE